MPRQAELNLRERRPLPAQDWANKFQIPCVKNGLLACTSTCGNGAVDQKVDFDNAVDADVTPTSASGVDVQFVRFTIFGVVGVDAPASARGALDTTYLDSELRVGRGDKGNLFVLAMRDREARLESQ